MAPKSKNPNIVFKNPDMRTFMKGNLSIQQIVDSGSGIAAGRVCEYTSGEIKLGTEQNTLSLGITRNAIGTDDPGTVEFGFVPCMAGSPITLGDRIAPRASGYVGKAQTAQADIIAATAGDAFTNQPANDGVEIVSDDDGDTTQTITLYGVLNGALTTAVQETLTLTGTTQVVSAHEDWASICGVRLSAECAGTITVREASGNQAICAITTGNLTAGIHECTAPQAYGLVPRHDASAACTLVVILYGTGLDGEELVVADQMNGTTEEDHNTTPFATVDEIHLGDVIAETDINLKSNEATDASCYCGIALQTTAVAGVPIDCWFKPYWM